MNWGDAEVRVAWDGSSVRLVRGDELVVELSWVGAAGAPAELAVQDEVEHVLITASGRVMQRQAINGGWRNRWVLTAEPSRTLTDLLRVRPGPEYSLWSWGSGVTAVLAVAPAHTAGPVLGFRLEQGYLEELEDPAPSSSAVDYRIAPAGTGIDVGQRLVTSIGAEWYPGMENLAGRLPPWLNDTQLDTEETWWSELADFGLSGPEGVQVEYSAGLVGVSGPVGRRILDVQTPRGLSRVPLEWVPGLEVVLHSVASAALGRGDRLSVAEALCVQQAADRHALWLDPSAEEQLDRVDWAASDSVLGAAFGLSRGRSLGEAALVSDALRMLGRFPVGVGYGRVVMSSWLASISLGMDTQARCHDLLGRPAVGRTAALESSLLHYRSVEVGGSELVGVANRLGGSLPGEAPLLTWTEQAQLVGLLELCPPEWNQAGHYAQVAEKARGQVLCGYADGRVPNAEPLAWLLLSLELGPGR